MPRNIDVMTVCDALEAFVRQASTRTPIKSSASAAVRKLPLPSRKVLQQIQVQTGKHLLGLNLIAPDLRQTFSLQRRSGLGRFFQNRIVSVNDFIHEADLPNKL